MEKLNFENHQYPSKLFTSYLSISHILFSNAHSQVTLLGCYGNLLDGLISSITIETNFRMLNTLLDQAGEQAETVIEQLANKISHPERELDVIDISVEGITFEDHLFAFSAMIYENEEGELEKPEGFAYRLAGFMYREGILDEFNVYGPPADQQELAVYYNKLLAMQYHFYLLFSSQLSIEKGLICSNLTDPFYFRLAQNQYHLLNPPGQQG
jgi:hypothetical protein